MLLEKNSVMGELPVSQLKLISAVGRRRIAIHKQIMIEIGWSHQSYVIVALVLEGLFSSMILGLDWLRSNKIIIDCEQNIVTDKMIGGSVADEYTTKEEDESRNANAGEEAEHKDGLMNLMSKEENGAKKSSKEMETNSRNDKIQKRKEMFWWVQN